MPARDSSLRDRLADRLTAVRRAVLRRRRLIAVLCTVGAVAAGLRATAPPAAPTTPVLVAARDLAAGATLGPDDLEVVEHEPGTVPGSALADEAEAVDAILAAPLRAGEPVTDVRLVGPGLADTAPGSVAVPVRLSDAAQVGLLTVGDEIDVLATDPGSRSTETVVTGAVVLAVPAAAEEAADAITGRLVVLGVPALEVSRVTAAAVTAFVTYAWSDR